MLRRRRAGDKRGTRTRGIFVQCLVKIRAKVMRETNTFLKEGKFSAFYSKTFKFLTFYFLFSGRICFTPKFCHTHTVMGLCRSRTETASETCSVFVENFDLCL